MKLEMHRASGTRLPPRWPLLLELSIEACRLVEAHPEVRSVHIVSSSSLSGHDATFVAAYARARHAQFVTDGHGTIAIRPERDQ